MKFTIEHELLSAQTDSVEVAERLILIIKNMEKVKDPAIEAYLHDTPRAKSEFGAGDAYRVPNINGEPNLSGQPFKGAIVMPDPLDEPKKYIEPLKKRVKEDTPAMNITSRLHDEKYGNEIHDGGNCVETDKGVVIMKKPETGNNRENIREIDDDEEIEIDSVPADDDPTPEIPHGQKIKSEDIQPAEGTVEEAYMGEHFEIQPKDPDEKPLTPAEQELWDYIQANPDYTMQSACRALKITTANYYWRKRQLFLKGKPVGGSLPFAAKPKD